MSEPMTDLERAALDLTQAHATWSALLWSDPGEPEAWHRLQAAKARFAALSGRQQVECVLPWLREVS